MLKTKQKLKKEKYFMNQIKICNDLFLLFTYVLCIAEVLAYLFR